MRKSRLENHANRTADPALHELFVHSAALLDRLLCACACSIAEAAPERRPELPGRGEGAAAAHAPVTDARVESVAPGDLRDARSRHEAAQLATLRRLVLVTALKDPHLASHVLRISHYGAVLAKALHLAPAETKALGQALALHDIGKIGIPDEIFSKPGVLTPEEQALMRSHTVIGSRILAGVPSVEMRLGYVVALTHHERWDGTGYPQGLCGEDIPLAGRICAVVDAFDAMSSARPYRPALAPEEALAELRRCRGLQFDPRLVDLFIERIDEVLELRELLTVGAAVPGQLWPRQHAA